jgi:hypothetical protein
LIFQCTYTIYSKAGEEIKSLFISIIVPLGYLVFYRRFSISKMELLLL